MTVRGHLEFALGLRRVPAAETAARVAELAGWLGLERLLDRRPAGLSGGERQRTALGRALSFRPGVLCRDEPLAALEEDTRLDMCRLLRDVQKRTAVTALHVTHSRREAGLLGDVVFEIADGKVRRRGSGDPP
jgi:ABC-type sugar transport system ATPase subunit